MQINTIKRKLHAWTTKSVQCNSEDNMKSLRTVREQWWRILWYNSEGCERSDRELKEQKGLDGITNEMLTYRGPNPVCICISSTCFMTPMSKICVAFSAGSVFLCFSPLCQSFWSHFLHMISPTSPPCCNASYYVLDTTILSYLLGSYSVH
jgi:hypothetical protein